MRVSNLSASNRGLLNEGWVGEEGDEVFEGEPQFGSNSVELHQVFDDLLITCDGT